MVDVRHRMLHPLDPGDKYRHERKGLPALPFMADLEAGWAADRLLVLEGEIKAAVVSEWLMDKNGSWNGWQVIGLQGINAWHQFPQLLGKNVYWWLDPDRREYQEKVCRETGGLSVAVPGTTKPDDAILAGLLDPKRLPAILAAARRVRK